MAKRVTVAKALIPPDLCPSRYLSPPLRPPYSSRLTVDLDGALDNVVANGVALGEVLSSDGGLRSALITTGTLTRGLSSCSKVGAPTGDEPEAAVGRTPLSAPVSGTEEVTSRWAPSSWHQRSSCLGNLRVGSIAIHRIHHSQYRR